MPNNKDEEITITYESLFDILRSEKKNLTLQKLPKTFFDDVLKYMKHKYEFLFKNNTEDIFVSTDKEKGLRELNNLKAIVKEIIERRIKKISDLAIISVKTKSHSSDVENMLDEEKLLFENFLKSLQAYHSGVIENLMTFSKVKYHPDVQTSAEAQENVEEEKFLMVRILNPVPKFIGPDLKIYGPFIEDDIVKLPKKIAEVLIKKKRAELL